MHTISIHTSQNIDLEYPIASLSDRIVAVFVDILVMIGYMIVWVILQRYSEWEISNTAWVVIAIPLSMYSLLNEIFFNGQSIGKRLMNIRVVRLDGRQATLSSLLLRWLLRPIDLWASNGLIGLISISVSKQAQRLGDIAAGTTVIKLKIVVEFWDSIFTEVQEDYVVQFPEIEMLSDRDMAILKDVLDMGINTDNKDLLGRLADKVKAVTGISSTMDDRTLLQTILKDYNFIYGQ